MVWLIFYITGYLIDFYVFTKLVVLISHTPHPLLFYDFSFSITNRRIQYKVILIIIDLIYNHFSSLYLKEIANGKCTNQSHENRNCLSTVFQQKICIKVSIYEVWTLNFSFLGYVHILILKIQFG